MSVPTRSQFGYWVLVMDSNGKAVSNTQMNFTGYYGRHRSVSDSDFTGAEYPPLSDVLEKHLASCDTCKRSLDKKPQGNLQGTNPQLCSEWYALIVDYAQREGEVNNIVAHDEYGHDAPKSPTG